MGKQQFAQKVDSNVKDAIEGLTEQYIIDKRIKEKGEIITLLYEDHKEKEKEREVMKEISKGDVLYSYLRRVTDLFYSNVREHETMIEMITSDHQEEVAFLEMKIKNLEVTVKELTRQLDEKTLEKKNAEDLIEKLKKKPQK